MPTALITGIAGQDGSYLAEFLLERDYDVVGLVRRTTMTNYERISHLQDRMTFVPGDLADEASIIHAVQQTMPDEVYNLGAPSFVGTSFDQPTLTGDVTALGVTRLLDSVRRYCPEARFYQAGSSEMFGTVTESPQNEDTPFHPRSPYGVAKIYGHWITVNYREHHGLHASSGITFNHESPRRGYEFVTRKITHAAARISLGLEEKVQLGNLEARRDWGFAGDFVEAMWLMLQQDEPDTYVIGTGRTHSVAEFCDMAFSHVDLDYRDHVETVPEFYRPTEPHQLVSDPSKAERQLGWTARTSLEELAAMMVQADLDLLEGRLVGLR